jgi:hypothetical protein
MGFYKIIKDGKVVAGDSIVQLLESPRPQDNYNRVTEFLKWEGDIKDNDGTFLARSKAGDLECGIRERFDANPDAKGIGADRRFKQYERK